MFEDSLMESGGKLKTKQGTTTAISFILQILLIGVLVLLPLIFTEALPKAAVDDLAGCAATSAAATASGRYPGNQDREAPDQRLGQWAAAYSDHHPEKSRDD